jgi:UTP--glucose-1-phosphate uridylyltransferase
MSAVRKAVIPAAGFGTRFLPVAKSVPKEMLPVLDKPVAQYVVEEAVQSGITDILFVVSRNKRPLEEFFHSLPELEAELAAKGRREELDALRRINDLARIHFVWQQEMRGLGDAVRHAESFVGDEPFAVLLGDCIVRSSGPSPVTAQLIQTLASHGGSAVALEEVPEEKVSRYGIAAGTWEEPGRVLRVNRWVEKPAPQEAPSLLAVSARYVFTPRIFQTLRAVPPGKNGEIQLTDAMAALLEHEPMFGVLTGAKRFDIGNKLDFVKANVAFALERPDTAAPMREFLETILKDNSP